MTTTNISFYKKIWEIKSQDSIPFDIFLDNIKNGTWQDIVIPIRTIKDEEKRAKAKEKAPSVTISGQFSERTDSNLVTHSGYIGIDIDDCDPEEIKSILCADQHVVAAFTSISGRGLCVIFKIQPSKHREAHDGILEYLYETYKIIADPTSVNPSRARFVSYDPHIYIADNPVKFTQYAKPKVPKKIDRVIFASDDFTEMLSQIQSQRLNICEEYHDWLRVGFSIAHKFGEAGREYFHIVSQHSGKYSPHATDKQYSAILKRGGAKGRDITISTFYYYCKQHGLQVYTQKTKTAAYSAVHGKKTGLSQQQVVANLEKFEGLTDVDDIVKQVFESNIEISEDSLIDEVKLWLRQNFSLRRNEITRYIEMEGLPMKQEDFNSIYIKALNLWETLPYDKLDRLIRSDFTPTYNPLKDWIERHKDDDPQDGLVDQLLATIETRDADYLNYFGKKWLVGMISAIYGEHSPLMLVLAGDIQNTGKTEFFRRLLPKDLMPYYAESKLDAGKDDEILMTQKLLIMDDEMGGKSKKEVKRLKELTSKQTFSLREPYGRNNVDLNRLAVLAGTSNENELLSDPTGNRRIIPIWVFSIDNQAYNAIDKTALFMEVYRLWEAGWSHRMTKRDIEYLKQDSEEFETTISESELLIKYFSPTGAEEWTASDIKIYIEQRTNQRLSVTVLGRELKRLGFKQKHIKCNGTTKRVYLAVETAAGRNLESVPGF